MGEKEPTRIGVEGGSESCARATAETKRYAAAASRVVMGGYDLRLKNDKSHEPAQGSVGSAITPPLLRPTTATAGQTSGPAALRIQSFDWNCPYTGATVVV